VGAAVAGLQGVFKNRSPGSNTPPPELNDKIGKAATGRYNVRTKDVRDEEPSGSSFTNTFPKSASRSALGKLAAKKEEEEREREEQEREMEEELERELARLKREEMEGCQDDEEGYGEVTEYRGDGDLGDTECGGSEFLSSSLSDQRRNLGYENQMDLEDSLNGQSPQRYTAPYVPPRRVFKTPFFPSGKVLQIDILSTWGDDLYVGLNGLDVFDEQGNLISSPKGGKSSVVKVETDLSSMEIAPEYQNDPREVSNLMNGTNFTRNDLHVWLAPLGVGDSTQHSDSRSRITTVTVTFSRAVTVSLIRVFNYNKSRTHCTRGVRECVFKLDDVTIFQGEIRMATGLLTSADTVSEVLLFTTDSAILEKVAQHDEKAGYYADDTTEEWLEKLKSKQKNNRPSTAEKNDNDKISDFGVLHSNNSSSLDFYGSDSLSFNSTQKTIDSIKSVISQIPNSQMSTLKAKHAERNVFYSAGNNGNSSDSVLKGKLNENSPTLPRSVSGSSTKLSEMKNSILPSNNDDNNSLRLSQEKEKNSNQNIISTLKKKTSIANLFEENNSSNSGGENNNENINSNNGSITNSNNTSNNNSNQNILKNESQTDKNYNVDDTNKKNSDVDFSHTSDLIDFLKELNGTNSTVQDEKEKQIEIEKIRKYDAEKENYFREKQLLEKQQLEKQNSQLSKPQYTKPPPAATSPSYSYSNSNSNSNSHSISVENSDIILCKSLTFLLENTWGDLNYIGLTGFEILYGNNCEIANLTEKNLFASPKDLSEIGDKHPHISFNFVWPFHCVFTGLCTMIPLVFYHQRAVLASQ
jgi:Domain of unknown function (DUF4457)